jgi:hypothetical protein
MQAVWKRVADDKRDLHWLGDSHFMFDFSQLRLGLDLNGLSNDSDGG